MITGAEDRTPKTDGAVDGNHDPPANHRRRGRVAPAVDWLSGILRVLGKRDGTPIGLTHYLFHRHCWRVENVIYLQDLYVDPEVRGTGAGRALIEAVYAAGDAAGCPTVYWTTQDFNATARQLYDRIATLTPFIKYQR